ncbi:hypothetical protein C9374_006064 [Naegleria lovaniensis]|uniref:Uncharacterized protein n=1 Tax=Naegleria lovaniensis TaxID=51637 RepID=A0AA88KJM1_NAELO|nr:uncharacterized protein C9374_006064 [Naegleria lovaniensis]KAG2381680.1 hypothetical protein C9374_006064 [Naegleria lovaniensis]
MSEDTIRFVDETKQTQDTYSYLKPIGIRKLRKQINTKEFKKNYFVIDTRKDEPMVVHYDSGTQGIAPNMQLTSANASSGTPSSGMITSPLKTPTRTPTFEFQNMCLNQPTNHGNTPQQLSQHAFFNPSSSSVSNPLIMNHPHSSPPTHELSMNYFGMDPMCMNVSTHTPASTPTSANGHHVQFLQAPFLPQQTQSTLTSSNA